MNDTPELDDAAREAATPARRRRQPLLRRSFTCQCGKPIFFRNSRCLACMRPLGYDAERGEMLALAEADVPGTWRAIGAPASRAPGLYRRCGNLDNAAGCNWLLPIAADEQPAHGAPQRLCRACRLNRTVPDLSNPSNGALWAAVERAKRRLVSALIALRLPVASKVGEDPERGLAFDLLLPLPGQPVTTGHEEGVITINLQEADDVHRERTRISMNESYRTLLGHLRHEVGHYYWHRLVENEPWHEPFRELFGDERADYAQALQTHYAQGPKRDWASRHVSAYASAHPWEDWGETWAHYLHIVDTLDTATSFGLDRQRADLHYERFGTASLFRRADERDARRAFLPLINGWIELTAVMNELARSMGQPDIYPFVLSSAAVTKLHFVHLLIQQQRGRGAPRRSAQPAQRLALPGTPTLSHGVAAC